MGERGALAGETRRTYESGPSLDPLASPCAAGSYAMADADKAGVAAPTARVFLYLGLLFHTKARYAEAEPPPASSVGASTRRAMGRTRPELDGLAQ